MADCEHTERLSEHVTKTWTHDEHGHVLEETWVDDSDPNPA